MRLAAPVLIAALIGAAGLGDAAPARAAAAAAPPGRTLARRGGKLSPRLATLGRTPSFASPRVAARDLSLPSAGAGAIAHAPDGRVMLEIRTSDTSAAGVDALRALGAGVVNVSPQYDTVTAAVDPGALAAIASDPPVIYVHEVLAPITAGIATPAAGATDPRCRPTVSEGDTLMHVKAARAQYEADGTGQTIGVLSDSFNTDRYAPSNAAVDVQSGDLPGPNNPCGYKAPVKVQSDYSGGEQADEGRAMIELAHGLAPAAHFAFATAANGDLSMADQINQLRMTNHASVIVDDAQYLDEPFFQDGPVADAANAASAAGVPYFSAAGNENVIVGGNNVSSYEAPSFRPTTCPTAIGAIETPTGCHNFDSGAGVDNTDAVTLAPNGELGIDLQWAEPWGGVANDYDVFLLNGSGTTVLAHSDFDNVALQEPVEFFGYTNNTGTTQTVQVVISKFSNAGNDSRIKFVMIGASRINAVEHNLSDGTDIVGPSIFGHTGAEGVGSTAAIPYNNSGRPEDYSSRGPVTLYYEPTPSTTALVTPQVMAKPDFAATDNVKNVFFATPAGGGIFRFAGTSAAAPQAAAIAALLRDYDSTLTPDQVMNALRSTARPVITNGTPEAVGGGYLDAFAALGTAAPPPRAPVIDSVVNGNGSVTLHWATRAGLTYPVTSSQITPFLNGVPQTPQTFGAGATQVVTGLAIGGAYRFEVQNTNANGTGPESAATARVVVGQPGMSRTVSAVPGPARATVSWTKPVGNAGPITAYDVGVFVNKRLVKHKMVGRTRVRTVLNGLKNATHYTFAVTAINGAAIGPRSHFSEPIVVGAPGPPTHVRAKAGRKQATIHWKAPGNNGRPIKGYIVTAFVAGRAVGSHPSKGNATSFVYPGLKSGSVYGFRVVAVNARGKSPMSLPSPRTKIK